MNENLAHIYYDEIMQSNCNNISEWLDNKVANDKDFINNHITDYFEIEDIDTRQRQRLHIWPNYFDDISVNIVKQYIYE